MAQPSSPRRLTICRHYRTKSMYTAGPDADPTRLRTDNLAHCWCLKTLTQFGPDQDPVDHADCVAGRRCFEPL